jgi:2'-5' RNA ligase
MRTFVAVEMPQSVREQFRDVEARLRQAEAHVKWVEPHNIHLTLKFLGDVAEDQLPSVFQAVAEGAQGLAPLQVRLSRLGAFPNLRRPRVVWIGVDQGKEALLQLQGRMEEAMARRNFPREDRPFSPHLTIGRVKSERGLEDLIDIIRATPFETESFEIDELVAMESTLTPDGPIYTPLHKVGLKK